MGQVVVLHVDHLRANYGPVEVLHGVNLHVNKGEIVSLLGANGAGKTTLLQCISRLHEGMKGSIYFNGVNLEKVPAEKMVGMGMAYVPEGRQIFSTLSVEDNLWLGASHRLPKVGKKKIREEIEEIYERFPILKERSAQLGGTLSGGQQQMLAIARALLARPQMLLLDEPSLGLAPLITKEILSMVQEIRNQWGTSILLVEQNAHSALKISDRAYVLHNGEIQMHGLAEDLARDARVQSAYLGHAVSHG